jgi:hypothetical protein
MRSEEARKEHKRKYGFRSLFFGWEIPGKYKWAGLALIACFLAVGGGVSWFVMRNAAFKLSDARHYTQSQAGGVSGGLDLSSGDAEARGRAPGEPGSGEDAAGSALKNSSPPMPYGGGYASPALSATRAAAPVRGKKDKRSPVSGSGVSCGSGDAGYASGENFQAAARSAGGLKGGSVPKASGAPADERGDGASIRVVQSGSGVIAGSRGKGGRTSVMEALRSAFKSNIYGARLASNDAARTWSSKTFDATADSRFSLEYDARLKAKLDHVSPNSIPDYLREEKLDASSAKSLGVSKVSNPFLDREGTKEALRQDRDYQRDKLSNEFMAAVFNPLGPFSGSSSNIRSSSSGGGSARSSNPGELPAPKGKSGPELPIPEDKGETRSAPSGGGGGRGTSDFTDPEVDRTLTEIAKEDLVESGDFGGECGCSAKNPCCCLPPNSLDTKQCPTYGPFQPGDPCGAGIEAGGGAAGDFPAAPAAPAAP